MTELTGPTGVPLDRPFPAGKGGRLRAAGSVLAVVGGGVMLASLLVAFFAQAGIQTQYPNPAFPSPLSLDLLATTLAVTTSGAILLAAGLSLRFDLSPASTQAGVARSSTWLRLWSGVALYTGLVGVGLSVSGYVCATPICRDVPCQLSETLKLIPDAIGETGIALVSAAAVLFAVGILGALTLSILDRA